jgi:Na+-transporting NADH:ubiquinone oxidoreductase subunit NqrE
MEEILFSAHSGWRYIVILVTLIAIVKMLIGWLGRSKWRALDQRLGMFTPIVFDIQLLLGLLLWIVQGRWSGDEALVSWEHPITMILAVAAAHITWRQVKKSSSDEVRFRIGAIGFIITGILIALGVMRVVG